ncbi:hypothetical protein TNCV_5119441 [Trichonephila clavipes]|nr:hypothetical protein TNCV_5119441 [Trichonephila clavipes]
MQESAGELRIHGFADAPTDSSIWCGTTVLTNRSSEEMMYLQDRPCSSESRVAPVKPITHPVWNCVLVCYCHSSWKGFTFLDALPIQQINMD